MMERVTETVAALPDADFVELADAAIDATIRLLFDEADLVDLWCRETLPETDDEFSRGITVLASTYEDAIRVGVTEGRIDCPDPRTTALLLVYAVEGTATHAILNRSGPTPDELIAAAQAMTHRVLGLTRVPTSPTSQQPPE